MGTVVASYRQLVRAYPTGGGDYEVASKNIGRSAGVIVASALLVDYVMTVAVSVSSGVDNIISAFPTLQLRARPDGAACSSPLLAAVNLRGIREAGLAFAAPTYLFMTGVFLMIITGLVRLDRRFPAGGRERALRRPRPARLRLARRARAGLPGAARVLVRLHRADRRRGDRQRRAGVPASRRPRTRRRRC